MRNNPCRIFKLNPGIKLFTLLWLSVCNSHNSPYRSPDICKFTATIYKSYFQPFTSFFLVFAIWVSSGAERMLVPKTENTYYPRRVYTQGHNSVFQTAVIKSWSDLRVKNVQVSAGFNIFPNHSQGRKPSKKPWFQNWKWIWN